MRTTRLIVLAAALALALPAAARAANICVWNYDAADTWYDTEAGQTIDCAYWVRQVLQDQGHTVEIHDTYLPSSLDGYDAVYCLMGWYRC